MNRDLENGYLRRPARHRIRLFNSAFAISVLAGSQVLAAEISGTAGRITGNLRATDPSSLIVLARPTKPRYVALSDVARRLLADPSELSVRPTAAGEFEFSPPSAGLWDFEVIRGATPIAKIMAVPIAGDARLPDLCLEATNPPCAEMTGDRNLASWIMASTPQAVPTRAGSETSHSRWQAVDSHGQPLEHVLAVFEGAVVGETDAQGYVSVPSASAVASQLEFLAQDGQSEQPEPTQSQVLIFDQASVVRLCLTTSSPLDRVSDAVARWSSDPGIFSISDKEGCFELSALREVDSLLVDKTGFRPLRLESAGLVKGGRPPDMTPTAPVLGLVVDEDGRAIAQAQVSYVQVEAKIRPSSRGESDSRGLFVLTGIPSGKYTVNISSPGRGKASRVVWVGAAGSIPRWETFVLTRPGGVRGRLVREGGEPLASALVALVPQGNSIVADRIELGDRRALDEPGVHYSEASSDGTFRIVEIIAGTYDLVVHERGGSKRFEGLVIPDEGLNAGDLVVPRGRVLTIRVLSRDDQPVENAQVALGTIRSVPRRYSREHVASPQATDGRGTAVFEGLAPNSVVGILVSAPGFAGFQGELKIATSDIDEIVRIDSAPQVCGHVVSAADGSEIGGANVSLRPSSEGREPPRLGDTTLVEMRSNPDGSFCLTSGAQGPHFLTVLAHGFRTRKLGLLVDNFGIDDEVVVLETASFVEGRVTSSDGEAVGRASVWLGTAGTATDQDGKYLLGANESGWLELGARHADFGRVTRQVLLTGAASQEENLVFPAGTRVTGHVRSESGEPVGNATVRLFEPEAGPGGVRFARAEADGSFAFNNVRSGSYRLSAIHSEVGRTEEVVAFDVDSEVVNIELILSDGRRLVGRVIGLHAAGRASVRAENAKGFMREAIIEPDGSFGFGPLSPGRWRLTLWVSGTQLAGETAVDIDLDDSSPVFVTLNSRTEVQR